MSFEIPLRDPCPFCLNISGEGECVFVHRDERFASFVNPGQLERGGLLVIPTEHFPTVLDLPEDIARDIHAHARRLAGATVAAFGATGVNIFQNNGVDAGQSVPHYHVHVVPRYPGSDPQRVFNGKEATRISVREREELADALRKAIVS